MTMTQKRTREAKDVKFVVAPVNAATPQPSDREQRPHLYWPKDRPRPTKFVRTRPAVPCAKCDRVLTDFGSQAVVCDGGTSASSGKAYLSCRVCGHRFPMALA